MRWLWMPLTFVVAAGLSLAVFGWRGKIGSEPPREAFRDMDVQPRVDPQGRSNFFADGRAMRLPVPGTVPFGGGDYFSDAGSPRQNQDFLQADDLFFRGGTKKAEGSMDFLKKMPVKLTPELMARGKERFNIYCAVCHGPAGYGNGVTTQYGMVGVGNFHQDKFRTMPDGEIFNTITNGKATMQPYASQVKPADRWAIVAWVRVLQRSQNANLSDVPEAEGAELERKQ